jgi:hypothetical protein
LLGGFFVGKQGLRGDVFESVRILESITFIIENYHETFCQMVQ